MRAGVACQLEVLIDNVMRRGQIAYLMPIVFAVVLATVVQGITSYSLTQLLSKAGQRLIYEMRIRIQEHIGRLPVSFYDANKTGTLVSRIMSDVEGVRNLIGTGLVELAGGLLTAVILLFCFPHEREYDDFRVGDSGCVRRGLAARL